MPRSIPRWRLAFTAAALAVALVPAASLLVLAAPTLAALWTSFWLALAGLVAATIPRVREAALAAALVAAGSCIALAWPRDSDASPIEVTLDGRTLASPWLDVPEIELVRIGSAVGLHPRERAAVDDGAALTALYGTRRPQRILETWITGARSYQLLRPAVAHGRKVPLVVFLHGNGGLFDAYRTLLAPLVDRGIAVALPRNRFGSWRRDDQAFVEDLRRRLVRDPTCAIDPSRIAIAGLSAGAMGALELFATDPAPWCGCVAVSGVPLERFDPTPGSLRGRRIHIVHGRADVRISAARVDQVVASLRRAGATIARHDLEGGHLVMVTRMEQVLNVLEQAVGR